MAVVTGLIVRGITWVYGQVRYRAIDPRDVRGNGLREVHVKPYTIEDASGETICACRGDRKRLAHRSVDDLLEDVLTAVRGLHQDGHHRELTFSDYFGECLDSGFVDEQKIRKMLRGELKADIKSTIARGEGNPPRVSEQSLDERLKRRYPSNAVPEMTYDLERRGEIARVGNEVIYYP